MFDFERPNIITEKSEDGRYGKFVVEPLERGYGTTLGNALRRIMLSTLPGAAVSQIKIDGLIYAQDGSTKCTQGKSLNAEEIITMNWLAQNVVGYIPKIGEMNERAQELMQLQGVKASAQTEMENK